MNSKTIVIGGLVVLALIAGGVFLSSRQPLGASQSTGPAHYQQEAFLQGLQIGNRGGTPLKLYASGTCNLQANFSITASTTRSVSCTGITLNDGVTYTGASTDLVDIQLAASTTNAAQYFVRDAHASTTANGSIEVDLTNFTGANATPAATNGFGSSTQFQIYR